MSEDDDRDCTLLVTPATQGSDVCEDENENGDYNESPGAVTDRPIEVFDEDKARRLRVHMLSRHKTIKFLLNSQSMDQCPTTPEQEREIELAFKSLGMDGNSPIKMLERARSWRLVAKSIQTHLRAIRLMKIRKWRTNVVNGELNFNRVCNEHIMTHTVAFSLLTAYCEKTTMFCNQEIRRLPFDWEEILFLLKKVYKGEILDIETDMDDAQKMNWFFTEAVPIVASDWLPAKFRLTRPYNNHVSTTDEMMVIWLIKHYPDQTISKRREDREECKIPRHSKQKLEDSIRWFFRTTNSFLRFKKQEFQCLTDEERQSRKKKVLDYINKQFDIREGRFSSGSRKRSRDGTSKNLYETVFRHENEE